MKIFVISFLIILLFLFIVSIVVSNSLPLKVESDGGVGAKVTNISNKNQEFYTWDCSSELSFISDNPLIYFKPAYDSGLPHVCEGLKRVILKPSESQLFDFRTYSMVKPNIFNLGFIYLNKNGEKDILRGVVWSDLIYWDRNF